MLLLLTRRVSVAVGVSCDAAAAWCSQICVDVGDNYECRCHAGYRLTDDGQSCVAADGKLIPDTGAVPPLDLGACPRPPFKNKGDWVYKKT